MTREEILAKIESPYSTVPDNMSSEVMHSVFHGTPDMLIEIMRSCTALLGMHIIGQREMVFSPNSKEQWFEAVKDVAKSHLKSCNDFDGFMRGGDAANDNS